MECQLFCREVPERLVTAGERESVRIMKSNSVSHRPAMTETADQAAGHWEETHT